MNRISLILNHPIFQRELSSIEELEKTRIYCGHNLDHLLAVARLGWIYTLEHNLPINKELWYSCALLHDIGRSLQYTKKIPHHEAGDLLAKQILTDCQFTNAEILSITEAIVGHRKQLPETLETMEDLIIWADKKSRNCFHCHASDTCNWSDEKRTKKIEY